MNVAKTILEQLGGNRFYIMTGAKNFVGGENYLRFSLPGKGVKQRGNVFQVILDPSDTYTLKLFKFDRKNLDCKELKSISDVYAEDLQDIFTEMTGLYTKL